MITFSEAIKDRTSGIERAYENANQEWEEKALDTLYAICVRNRLVCADDLVEAMEGQEEKTHTLNAISGLFRAGVSKGWMRNARCSCGEECKTVESGREGNNHRRIQIYESLVYTPILWN